jgi:hypothetical protein
LFLSIAEHLAFEDLYDEVHGVYGKLKDDDVWKDFIEKLNAVGPNSLARRVYENLPKGESDGNKKNLWTNIPVRTFDE